MSTPTSALYNNAPLDIKQSPDKYTAVGDLLNQAAANLTDVHGKSDISEMLVQTYGDQGITGFLKLTGAVTSAGASDQIEWYEAGRRHRRYNYASSAWADGGNSLTIGNTNIHEDDSTTDTPVTDFEAGDVFLEPETGKRLLFASESAGTFTFHRLDGTAADITDVDNTNGGTLLHIGNMYSQGSDQPDNFMDPTVKRRINTYAIVKDRFQVNGSQATNVGYINIGNGDYRWFMYGEQEARKRFEDRREMILLFGELNDGGTTSLTTTPTGGANGNFAGTEGYITALQERGIKMTGEIDAMNEIDLLIAELDANGAVPEYACYVNRAQSLSFDDLVANEVGPGANASYGAFQNSADMAVKLGFKSFTRGGYTFHKHDWKLLNDPSLLGADNSGKFKGVMTPLTSVADARTGISAPALEMKYKASNGYSREMEHWVTGGGIMGHTNGDAGRDVMTFHYRSEVALCTRAANQHVLIQG